MKSQRKSKPIRRKSSLLDALFSSTQQKVLTLFFAQPERKYTIKELIELADSGSGAVQREVERLALANLLTIERVGRQKFYKTNQAAPVFHEMSQLILKTSGIPNQIRVALSKVAAEIELAMIYGSVAKKSDTASSDIDLLVVSDTIDLAKLYEALAPVESAIGRPISPTLYTSSEVRERLSKKNAFLSKVLSGEKVILIGDENEIAQG